MAVWCVVRERKQQARNGILEEAGSGTYYKAEVVLGQKLRTLTYITQVDWVKSPVEDCGFLC